MGRGLRFRAAADADYRLAVLPPPGFVGELSLATTVRIVAASSPSPWRRLPLPGAVEPRLPPDADGDGLWDAIDLCRLASDPTNRDGDRDRVGNAATRARRRGTAGRSRSGRRS